MTAIMLTFLRMKCTSTAMKPKIHDAQCKAHQQADFCIPLRSGQCGYKLVIGGLTETGQIGAQGLQGLVHVRRRGDHVRHPSGSGRRSMPWLPPPGND